MQGTVCCLMEYFLSPSIQALVKRVGGIVGVADSPLSPRERTLFSDTAERGTKKEEKTLVKKGVTVCT